MFPRSWLVAALLAVGLHSSASASPPLYQVTDLGDLPGGNSISVAYGINSAGDVVGSGFSSGTFGPEAILWSGGSIIPLGDLTGGITRSEAFAINDLGVIVGRGADASASFRAVRWIGGVPGDLGDLPGGSSEAWAFDINTGGRIVGRSGGSPTVLATRWDGGSIDELGIPGGGSPFPAGSSANGVNVFGVAVGNAAIGSGGGSRALVWDADGTPMDLGTLFPQLSDTARANDINDLGEIVGWTGITGETRAVRWVGSVITDLGDLPGGVDSSEAHAINDAGSIVGQSSSTDGTHAFLWEDGTLYDLNDLLDPSDPLSAQTELLEAFDINDSGQIVGRATFPSGTHAFLLTPLAPAVPAASTSVLLLLAAALGGAAILRLQRVR